jgi:hypothetical protein
MLWVGSSFGDSKQNSGGMHTDVCAALPGMAMPGTYEVGRPEQFGSGIV